MKNNDFKPDEYEIKSLLYNDPFNKDVELLRKQFNIPLGGFNTSGQSYRWKDKLSEEEFTSYKGSVELLMFNYSLGYGWRDGLLMYIELGNEGYLRVRHNWGLRYSYKGESINPEEVRDIRIDVDPGVTLKDLEEAHKAIRKLVSKAGMKTKKQLIKNLDRDYAVYRKHKEGLKVNEITKWLNDTEAEAFNDDNTKKIITRARKKFGERHPWST